MKTIVSVRQLVFVFVIAALLIACFPLRMLALSDENPSGLLSADSSNQESTLSDENTEKALDIIHRAGGKLTESDKKKLLVLGLTEEQIQMLQGLSGETANIVEGSDNWVEKEIKWYDKPAVLFFLLGTMIAGVIIILIWTSRTLLFHNNRKKE